MVIKERHVLTGMIKSVRCALLPSYAGALVLAAVGMISPLIAEDVASAEAEPPAVQQTDAEQYHKLQRARVLISQGEPEAAYALLEEVALAQPENQSIALELERLRVVTLRSNEIEDTDEKRVERLLAEANIRVHLNRIQQLMAQQDFEAADIAIVSAQAQLQNHPWPEAKDAIARLEALLAEARERQQQRDAMALRELRQRSQDAAQLVSDMAEAAEISIFATRMDRILGVQQKGLYELALSQARLLVKDHPTNPKALALYDNLLNLVYDQRQMNIEERQVYLKKEVFERIHQALIPDGIDGSPIFPADWERRSKRLISGLDAIVEIPAWQVALMERASERLDSIDFAETDPVEALVFIAERTGINIVLSSEIQGGAFPPVSLQARGMRIDNIVTWICRQMGVTWAYRRNAIMVDIDEFEDAELRIYDISEAIFGVNDFPGPDLSVMQLAASGGGGGGGGGGGFDLFGGGAGGGEDEGIGPEDLIDLIREAVSPEAWDNPEYGIEVHSGNYLVVNAPPALHGLIQDFIRSQLGVNRTMVHTEMRWLRIDDQYLEEIGVDWGGPNSSLVNSPSIGTDGFRRGNASSDALSVGTIINRLPATAMDIAPTIATSGLNLQVLSLGSTYLQGILTAVERTGRGRFVSAIDLTTMNGQRGHAMFVRQIAYISDYEIDGGEYNPVISTVNVGDLLDIRPLVSADRKFVTMDIRPFNSSVSFFTERLQVATDTVDDVIAGFNGFVLPPLIFGLPIELPNLQVNTAGTRVMIPDGGSVMVAGFVDALNQTTQSNVPLLGHVPFVGRLFGKRGRYSQNTKLYLTVTVDIILYDEEEALL